MKKEGFQKGDKGAPNLGTNFRITFRSVTSFTESRRIVACWRVGPVRPQPHKEEGRRKGAKRGTRGTP